ncbi:hypothetical protein KM043_004537 [Ampulex compressa]|nr:hypothetical protein KM043_004537 [Ampulex compressa]
MEQQRLRKPERKHARHEFCTTKSEELYRLRGETPSRGGLAFSRNAEGTSPPGGAASPFRNREKSWAQQSFRQMGRRRSKPPLLLGGIRKNRPSLVRDPANIYPSGELRVI